jgi:hypothetical protein
MTQLANAAFESSRDTALGRAKDGAVVSQKARMLELNTRIAAHLDSVGPAVKRHRQHMALPLTTSLFTKHDFKIREEFFSAALRLRLFSPVQGAPAHMACPGCGVVFGARDWMLHAPSCTRVVGFNASSRHASLKKEGFEQLMRVNHIPLDTCEPRDVRTTVCPGCKKETVEAAFEAHAKDCSAWDALRMQKPRGSGPDIRCYGVLPTEGDTAYEAAVIDVSVVAAESTTHSATPLECVFDAVTSRKRHKYEPAALKIRNRLVVAAVTEAGALSKETLRLVDAIADSSGMRHVEARAHISAVAAHAHGGSLLNAERKAGIRICRAPSPAAFDTACAEDGASNLRVLAGGPWLRAAVQPVAASPHCADSATPQQPIADRKVLRCGLSPIAPRAGTMWTGNAPESCAVLEKFSAAYPWWKHLAREYQRSFVGKPVPTSHVSEAIAWAAREWQEACKPTSGDFSLAKHVRTAMRLTGVLDEHARVCPLIPTISSSHPVPPEMRGRSVPWADSAL